MLRPSRTGTILYGPEASACVCVSRRTFFPDPTQLHVGRARRIRLLRPCRLELPLADADQALEQALDPLKTRVHVRLAANELLELRGPDSQSNCAIAIR